MYRLLLVVYSITNKSQRGRRDTEKLERPANIERASDQHQRRRRQGRRRHFLEIKSHTRQGDAHAVTADIQPIRGDPVERYVVPNYLPHRLSTLTGMSHLGMRETNRHSMRTATSPELRNASSAQNKVSGTRARSLCRSRDSPHTERRT